jgi:hypothetical protein
MDRSELERYGWIIEFLESTKRVRPDLPVEVVERVYDRLVDLLMRRSDMGQSRAAVFALGRKQLKWRTSDALRAVYTADGEWKATPSAALSLDQVLKSSDGDGSSALHDVVAAGGDDPVASRVLDRLELAEILATTDTEDEDTGRVVRGAMAGYSTKEIAEATGMKPNTVDQRRSRFVRRFNRGEAA